MILTNGTHWVEGDKQITRKFKLIATHEEMSWVKALNGNYAGEMLTFESRNLFPISEAKK